MGTVLLVVDDAISGTGCGVLGLVVVLDVVDEESGENETPD